MIALILIGSFQSAMLLMLLLAKRQKNLSDYCLAGYFVASTISIILAYLEISNRNNGYPFPWLIAISVPKNSKACVVTQKTQTIPSSAWHSGAALTLR